MGKTCRMAMYPENAVSDNPKNVLPGRLFPPLRAFCGTSASQVVISALIMSTLPLQNDYLEAKSNVGNQGNSLEEAKEGATEEATEKAAEEATKKATEDAKPNAGL